jgi:malate dehydrogenase (oxaloacetate-decarboxylating)
MVTSDASALPNQSLIATVLAEHATAIQDLGGPPALPMPVTSGEEAQCLPSSLLHPPSDAGALYLAHMDPRRAETLQRRLGAAAGPPVISDHDTTAIAITAALLTTLSRPGRSPARSRVILAGADRLPALGPLLMVAGVADLTAWEEADARRFPLAGIAGAADVVVDLTEGGTCPPLTGAAIITPHGPTYPILALPGLLRALIDVPRSRVDVDVFLAAAGALVAATPPDRLLPVPEPALTDSVVWAVSQALRHPRELP